MQRCFLPGLMVLALWACAPAAEVRLQGESFSVPEGMTLELAAQSPQVEHPGACVFDDQGRLYVAEQKPQLGGEGYRISQLIDADGDGAYERSFLHAEFPHPAQGLQWHEGVLYVALPGAIWAVPDTDEGEPQPALWRPGQGEQSTLRGPWSLGGSQWWWDSAVGLQRQAGERLEMVARVGGASSAPLGLTFTPEGEVICAAGWRGEGTAKVGLALVGLGQVLPLGAKAPAERWPGESVQPFTSLSTGAPGAMLRYRGFALGPEWHDAYVVTLPGAHAVHAVAVERTGSGYREASRAMVQGPESFRPADVAEDGDGSLLMVDAGNGAANRPGAVYRLRKVEAPAVEDPWGNEMPWGELNAGAMVVSLTDTRPMVVQRAQAGLARTGDFAAVVIRGVLPDWPVPTLRLTVLWTLAPIETSTALNMREEALGYRAPEVRAAAARIAGLSRMERTAETLAGLLLVPSTIAGTRSDPGVAVAAAEALARLEVKAGEVDALIKEAPGPEDPIWEHAIIYALSVLATDDALRAGLTSERGAFSRRAAALALHARGKLRVEDFAAWRTGEDALLRETAEWLAQARGAAGR